MVMRKYWKKSEIIIRAKNGAEILRMTLDSIENIRAITGEKSWKLVLGELEVVIEVPVINHVKGKVA